MEETKSCEFESRLKMWTLSILNLFIDPSSALQFNVKMLKHIQLRSYVHRQ